MNILGTLQQWQADDKGMRRIMALHSKYRREKPKIKKLLPGLGKFGVKADKYELLSNLVFSQLNQAAT